MLGKKIQLDTASTQLLKTFKSRTGLTHQYTCRLAFCLSLAEVDEIRPDLFDEQGIEFNRYTLTGEYDQVIVALLREWMTVNDSTARYSEAAWFRAHINRGLTLLLRRVRRPADIAALVAT